MENKQVLEELRFYSASKGLKENKDVSLNFTNDQRIILIFQIIFLKSIPTDLRWGLLFHSQAVLYTPANEHFGIVPVEAMAIGTPVIARRSGGPMESIADGKTVKNFQYFMRS